MLYSLLFYVSFFSLLTIISSYFVLTSTSPVQSVLFLILTFTFVCCLLLVLGLEFLAVVLLVVYVGAISILILFIVMMFNLRSVELYFDLYSHMPVAAFIGVFCFSTLMISFVFSLGFPFIDFSKDKELFFFWYKVLFWKNNLWLLCVTLYNTYFYFIISAGIILFIAMLGVIILTVDFEYRTFKKVSLFKKSDGHLVQSFKSKEDS